MSSRDGREILSIAALLAATVVFGLGLLPMGIELGYGSDGAGLSPRFMPQLAVMGIGLALAYGLIQSILGNTVVEQPLLASEHGVDQPLRALGVALICMLFAYFGFNLAGFYLGGVAMAIMLMLLLGERKLHTVLLFPLLVLALVYVILSLGCKLGCPRPTSFPAYRCSLNGRYLTRHCLIPKLRRHRRHPIRCHAGPSPRRHPRTHGRHGRRVTGSI